MQTTHLYIDHQSLAPLIHALEDVVEYEFEANHLLGNLYLMRRTEISIKTPRLPRVFIHPEHSVPRKSTTRQTRSNRLQTRGLTSIAHRT